MPRSGTGTYVLPISFQTGQTISAPDMMTDLNDIGTALTGSLAADGQTPVLGNFDWGGKNITNVGTMAATAVAMNSGVSSGVFFAADGTSGDQVVNYSQFPATLTSTGTMTLPSGYIRKWGTGSTTAGSGSVTFAAAFPSSCHNVQITINGGSGTTTLNPLVVGAVTTAGFAVWGDAAQSLTFYWDAIGS
jgi:hypothetical protein